MIKLFKEEEFPQYIDHHLPFLDRDTEYSFLAPYIQTSEKEIIKLLGKEAFSIAQSAFDAEEPTSNEKDILFHFRQPILINAYRLYAPTADLSHGNNGRKMRNKEDETHAFEWMLNRDDENQERAYYRELDNLIYFLEDYKVWRDSETFKKMKSLLVHSTEVFNEHFPIESRLLFIKIIPGLKQAQKKHIAPLIGKDLFNKLQDSLLTYTLEDLQYYPNEGPNQPTTPEEEEEVTLQPLEKEVLELCQEACVYFSLEWAMKRLKVTLFPKGILQNYVGDRQISKAKKVPEYLETQLAAQEFHKDAYFVLNTIESTLAEMKQESAEEATKEDILEDFINFDNDNEFMST